MVWVCWSRSVDCLAVMTDWRLACVCRMLRFGSCSVFVGFCGFPGAIGFGGIAFVCVLVCCLLGFRMGVGAV